MERLRIGPHTTHVMQQPCQPEVFQKIYPLLNKTYPLLNKRNEFRQRQHICAGNGWRSCGHHRIMYSPLILSTSICVAQSDPVSNPWHCLRHGIRALELHSPLNRTLFHQAVSLNTKNALSYPHCSVQCGKWGSIENRSVVSQLPTAKTWPIGVLPQLCTMTTLQGGPPRQQPRA